MIHCSQYLRIDSALTISQRIWSISNVAGVALVACHPQLWVLGRYMSFSKPSHSKTKGSVTPLIQMIKTFKAAFSFTLYLAWIGREWGIGIVREGGKGNACENVSCEEIHVSQSVHDLVSESEHHPLAHSVPLCRPRVVKSTKIGLKISQPMVLKKLR